jgi:hypothetical protein
MPVIPALKRLRQRNQEFKVTLGYIVRPCLRQTERDRDRERGHLEKKFLNHLTVKSLSSKILMILDNISFLLIECNDRFYE